MEYIDDPRLGIVVYRNQLNRELNLPERLENLMKVEDFNDSFQWREALVGNQQKMPDYRDCWDFKISEQFANLTQNTKFNDLQKMYYEIKTRLDSCVKEYTSKYHITMNFMEAINFIKYEKGQHFYYHADHGFSYVCTVSSVMYLNDDYEGGELSFSNIGIEFKPKYGDIILFPSTYIYAHASLPVKEGTKYSAVTMFDYSDKYHKPEFYQGNN